MHSSVFGFFCLMVFAVSSAVRDTFLGHVFQSVSVFLVLILGFGLSTLVFLPWGIARQPLQLGLLMRHARALLHINALTAGAFLAYFFGLKNLEPAVVNAIYTGVGPITVLALRLQSEDSALLSTAERMAYAGLLASVMALATISAVGWSGLPAGDLLPHVGSLAAVIAGGVAITLAHTASRRLGEAGLSSSVLTGSRFLATLCLGVILELLSDDADSSNAAPSLLVLAAATFGLIAIPSLFLQMGIARSPALAVNAFRALGPVFVFAAQQADGRLQFSGATLAGITAFCVFAIACAVSSAWTELNRH